MCSFLCLQKELTVVRAGGIAPDHREKAVPSHPVNTRPRRDGPHPPVVTVTPPPTVAAVLREVDLGVSPCLLVVLIQKFPKLTQFTRLPSNWLFMRAYANM